MFLNKSKEEHQFDPVLKREDEYRKGLAVVKDLIAPAAFRVTPNYLEIGETFSKTIFVMAFPRFLSVNWFAPIINIDFPINISIFVHPVDSNKILKGLLKSTTQIQSRINLEAESGKVRNPMLESALENVEANQIAGRYRKIFSGRYLYNNFRRKSQGFGQDKS